MPKLLLLSICCAILLTFDVIDAQSFRQLRKVHITKCAKAKSLEERGLCSAVMSPFDRQDAVTYREFEVTSRNFDLNGDGRPETIAWISSLGGHEWPAPVCLVEERRPVSYFVERGFNMDSRGTPENDESWLA